ncbi:hypothetical protein DFP72DRAFT_136491 [Ephemerocybe angulata]|uniref:MYND-type domain-containing protein n=1 Tax=Ephemerocybe angulata TaxID=980116 RepID=A0A8H6I615_9AGAR|nr:hypothetical protein DFP72DRAFT_136491 [Tulosesus angulatus]
MRWNTSRTRVGMRKVTPELLQRALAGSIPDMNDLTRGLAREEFGSSEAIDVIFKFLHSDLVPNLERRGHDQNEFKASIDRAFKCLAMLNCALHESATDESLREGLIQNLLDNVDGICSWTRFILVIPDVVPSWKGDLLGAHNRNSRTLQSALAISGRVFDAFISSSGFIDLVLQLWFREDENKELLLDIGGPLARSIPSLFNYILQRDEGVDVVVQRVLQRRLVARMASSLTRRARQLSEDPVVAARPSEASKYFYELTAIGAFLLDSENEDVIRTFAAANYLGELCSSLDVLSAKLQRSVPKELYMSFQALFTSAAKARTHVVENWARLIEGGAVSLLARLIPCSQKHPELGLRFPFLSSCTLALSVLHPEVTRALLAIYPSGKVPGLKRCTPGITGQWASAWSDVSHFIEVFRDVQNNEVTICDNPACYRREKRMPEQVASQQCSGCSSVIYCSRECQDEDWRAYHRLECGPAQSDRDARRSACTWYRHSSRQAHMTWTASLLRLIRHPECSKFCTPGFESNELLVNIDCSAGTPQVTLMELKEVEFDDLWEGIRENTTFSQVYLKSRFAAMIDMFKEGSLAPGGRLVDISLRFGNHGRLSLLVVTERIGNAEGEEYKPICSIVRHGYDASLDLEKGKTYGVQLEIDGTSVVI